MHHNNMFQLKIKINRIHYVTLHFILIKTKHIIFINCLFEK